MIDTGTCGRCNADRVPLGDGVTACPTCDLANEMPRVKGHSHRIYVDPSLTGVEAWHELRQFGRRVTYTGDAAVLRVQGCDGGECRNVEPDAWA